MGRPGEQLLTGQHPGTLLSAVLQLPGAPASPFNALPPMDSPHLGCGACRLVGLRDAPRAFRACCHSWAAPIASWWPRALGT